MTSGPMPSPARMVILWLGVLVGDMGGALNWTGEDSSFNRNFYEYRSCCFEKLEEIRIIKLNKQNAIDLLSFIS